VHNVGFHYKDYQDARAAKYKKINIRLSRKLLKKVWMILAKYVAARLSNLKIYTKFQALVQNYIVWDSNCEETLVERIQSYIIRRQYAVLLRNISGIQKKCDKIPLLARPKM
jgi:hypothetical protein